MAKKKYLIKLTYFKETGKLYASGEVELEAEVIASGPGGMPYMGEVVDSVRDLRERGKLPGLADGSHWPDGYILIDCEEGYPHLLRQEKGYD